MILVEERRRLFSTAKFKAENNWKAPSATELTTELELNKHKYWTENIVYKTLQIW